MAYDTILVETRGKVGLVTLNRPQALNALNSTVVGEINRALDGFEADPNVGCVVITGSEKAFAAGADIKEMQSKGFPDTYLEDFITAWDRVASRRKPIVAAVAGFALGGGCELAMACDIVIAADDATFGQPEIKIGIMPGAGGTQRLTRALGKAKAMELILTGRNLSAREAWERGLVAQLVAREEVVPAALALAAEIASMPPLAVRAAKEAVNRAHELSLEAGLEFERRNFFLLFASEDQKEGMRAFIEKRKPEWKGQ
ncbi:MAG TPA: enoyl-CoA hydratase-related protein [Candidatus Limnocylindrales bacterium]|nr:enoyl-CoA hydratase-related protein [Candidatus Limnocylindrales bacterium]